jgi:hypothetical protein
MPGWSDSAFKRVQFANASPLSPLAILRTLYPSA